MRAVVQRVKSGSVRIQQKTTGKIDEGIVVLLGIHAADTSKQLQWMADKIINLRIFDDENGKMNRSLADIGGEVLIVSQFTLYGDCRKGRRPGYSTAASPDIAEPLYLQFVDEMKNRCLNVATGTFQAEMEIELINDGPVTLLLDSEKTF